MTRRKCSLQDCITGDQEKQLDSAPTTVTATAQPAYLAPVVSHDRSHERPQNRVHPGRDATNNERTPASNELRPVSHDRAPDVMATQPLVTSQSDDADTDWIAQPWTPCSVTCGQGIRERQVDITTLTRLFQSH